MEKPKRMGNRVFQSIFLILCLLLILMLGYMTFFMNQVVIKSQVAQLDRSYLQLLEQANQSAERLIEDLDRQVLYFLSSPSVMQYLTNPQDSTPDQTMNILRELGYFTDIYSGVSGVFLYAPTSDTVLSSDGFLTAAADAEIGALLAQYPAETVSRSRPDFSEYAVVQDGTLYIIFDFLPAHCLGRYIFQMDIPRLQALMGTGEAWTHLSLADSRGQVFLDGTGLIHAPPQVFLEEEAAFYTAQTDARSPRHTYYRVDCTRLGWHFLMRMEQRQALQDRTSFWMAVIPMLGALLLLGTLGAYAVTRKIYTPINRLMTLVAGLSDLQVPEDVREIDYLEAAYEKTWQDNAALRTRFSGLGKTLRSYLCREALSGLLHEGLDGESLLGLPEGGRFQVAILRFGESGSGPDAIMNYNLQVSLAEKALQKIPHCLCTLEESRALVTVFYFPPSAEAVQEVPQGLDALQRTLSEDMPCPVFLGVGTLQPALSALRESYDAALESVRYRSYVAADTGAQSAPPPDKTLERQLRQVIDGALLSKTPVSKDCQAILSVLAAGGPSEAELQRGYQLAEDIFMEKLVLQGHPHQTLPPPIGQSGPITGEVFRGFCERALEQGRAYAGKKKYHYVEAGKRYMEEHYENAGLGINDISAHVGISPSYFSSLFNEVTQDSVVSYLNEVRIRQAKAMLQATRIPVKEVGFRCGFNSANVFGRVFKRYTALSPKQYRDRHTSGQEEGPHAK